MVHVNDAGLIWYRTILKLREPCSLHTHIYNMSENISGFSRVHCCMQEIVKMLEKTREERSVDLCADPLSCSVPLVLHRKI